MAQETTSGSLPIKTEYKVTITQIQHNVPTIDKEYKDTGKKDEDGDKVYEYVYFDTVKTVDTLAYSQTITDLNIQEVIKAVNGIGEK